MKKIFLLIIAVLCFILSACPDNPEDPLDDDGTSSSVSSSSSSSGGSIFPASIDGVYTNGDYSPDGASESSGMSMTPNPAPGIDYNLTTFTYLEYVVTESGTETASYMAGVFNGFTTNQVSTSNFVVTNSTDYSNSIPLNVSVTTNYLGIQNHVSGGMQTGTYTYDPLTGTIEQSNFTASGSLTNISLYNGPVFTHNDFIYTHSVVLKDDTSPGITGSYTSGDYQINLMGTMTQFDTSLVINADNTVIITMGGGCSTNYWEEPVAGEINIWYFPLGTTNNMLLLSYRISTYYDGRTVLY